MHGLQTLCTIVVARDPVPLRADVKRRWLLQLPLLQAQLKQVLPVLGVQQSRPACASVRLFWSLACVVWVCRRGGCVAA